MADLTQDVTWVPVLRSAATEEQSLREVLVGAHAIDDLDWGDAMGAAALLGILTTIVAEAEGIADVDDLGELWGRRQLDESAIDAYLAQHRDRFDLFSPSTPFGQVAGLEPLSGGAKSVALLVPTVASGNNTPLFSSSTEAEAPSLSPAEAARRLVALHAWDTAAIKTGAQGDPKASGGKTTGNPTGPLGATGFIALIGGNLFETLVLNVPALRARDGDLPAWRQPPVGASWEIREPLGPLDLATWQSRRVRLYRDDAGDVSGVLVAAGDRMPFVPDVEMRTGWVRPSTSTKGGPTVRPRRHQPGRAGWRGLAALLVEASSDSESAPQAGVLQQLAILVDDAVVEQTHPVDVQIVGVVYGNQSAVVEHVIVDRSPLPLRALAGDDGLEVRTTVQFLSDQADAVMRAVNDLGDNLREAAGGEKIPWDKGQRPGDLFIHRLAVPAQRLLAGLAREPDRAVEVRDVWAATLRTLAWEVADPMLDDADPITFLGQREPRPMRQQLAEVYFRSALNKALPATTIDSEVRDD